jgi:hypothetical protein
MRLIEALQPRFRKSRQTILAVERLGGRKEMLAFAKRHDDLDLKAVVALEAHDLVVGDWALALNLLTELVEASNETPSDRRKMKELRRRYGNVLAKRWSVSRPRQRRTARCNS